MEIKLTSFEKWFRAVFLIIMTLIISFGWILGPVIGIVTAKVYEGKRPWTADMMVLSIVMLVFHLFFIMAGPNYVK